MACRTRSITVAEYPPANDLAAAASTLLIFVWMAWRYRTAQLRRGQAAQQAFSRQLIESQERERQRIAAELHDSLGQNLLVVKNRALLGAMSQPNEAARNAAKVRTRRPRTGSATAGRRASRARPSKPSRRA